jgi:RNA polymerase sigma-70 factor (ECF subfamily)
MGEAARRREAEAARWGVNAEVLAGALARSTAKAFAGRTPAPAEIERYQQSLHLADLALACACMEGHPEAWDHFVMEFRPVLYRAADAIDRSGNAREVADALYGELYSKSLFRYFHGRSSLATWLRSLVSQRYVDRIRETRRLDPLPEESSPDAMVARTSATNPDRGRFVTAMHAVLAAALAALEPRARLRLRCYYAQEMTLAQIGRVTREHEATVSRQLARTRKAVRADAERRLRDEHRFTSDEIAECFSSISEDAGTLDLGDLLSERLPAEALLAKAGKKSDADRSKPEDVS